VILAGGVLVAIAGACSAHATEATNESPPENVTVVGDSLTYLAQAQIVSTGADLDYRVAVDGIPGLTWAQRIDRVEQVAGSPPDVVVVELGTNDVLQNVPLATTTQSLDQAVEALADAPCVVFVNVGLLFGDLDGRDAYNEALDRAVEGHSNMTVFDWKSLLDKHHAWSGDGIHLRPQYEHEFAEPILETAHDHCATSS
jgi:lysophospholipase L1-like esterase